MNEGPTRDVARRVGGGKPVPTFHLTEVRLHLLLEISRRMSVHLRGPSLVMKPVDVLPNSVKLAPDLVEVLPDLHVQAQLNRRRIRTTKNIEELLCALVACRTGQRKHILAQARHTNDKRFSRATYSCVSCKTTVLRVYSLMWVCRSGLLLKGN